MSQQRTRIVSVGEVMIEMARGSDGRFAQACGGDTFNTAVYLARAGLPVSYATALGNDPYSDRICALATTEGISTDLIVRVPGRMAGLYLIETDEAGERTFHYWRDTAPARDLFELPEWGRIAEGIASARIIYFSGITLSLYSNTGLGRFLAILELARQAGAKVVFDSNYRPRNWRGDLQRTRTVYIEALKRVDIALPTSEDDVALFAYSGHGSQGAAPEEFWSVEPDRLNETLVLYDSRSPGQFDLADKELTVLIGQVAKAAKHFTAILDCCHSGSGTRDPEIEPVFAERRAPYLLYPAE